MSQPEKATVILAAGQGTRMNSALPKVLHRLAGQPMILALLDSLQTLAPRHVVLVVGPEMENLTRAAARHPLNPLIAVQNEALGTGHAVIAARGALQDFTGDVLILCGDTPLVEPATLAQLHAARAEAPDAALALLGFRPVEPGAYGRLITDGEGNLQAIVEAHEADPRVLTGDLCNSGIMVVDGGRLFGLLDGIGTDNAKGEYYLTDIVELARAEGLTCRLVEGAEDELMGINTRADLAAAEAMTQVHLRARAMEQGATLIDPFSVYFSFDTYLGRDVIVGPNVFFGPGVTVGDGVEIKGFCHIEGATIEPGATVGPFARLRPGAEIGMDARIGNFVEVKQASIEAGAKVSHLSYIGDARIGAGANIGAGTITCNYDGMVKSLTEIGAGAFIGSNTALVAPVRVGAGATIGAGSVITENVAPDALALTRPAQKEVPGWSTRQQAKADKADKADEKS